MKIKPHVYQDLNVVDSRPAKDPFTKGRYRQFARYVPDDARSVLDVGCNAGKGGEEVKRLRSALQLFGLDCVAHNLEKVIPGIYRLLLCCSATHVALANESMDAVMAGEFIEHIYDQDIPATLNEFFRVLKKNGVLLLTTPNPDFLLWKLTGGSPLGGPHVSLHYPRSLEQSLRTAGFSRVTIVGSGIVSSFLGVHFPLFSVYGSYLVIAHR